MKYKEYLISNKLLNIYTKWLSLCNLTHTNKTFELFYKDFIIWYMFNKCIPEQFPKGFLDNINDVEFKLKSKPSSGACLYIVTIYNEEETNKNLNYLRKHKTLFTKQNKYGYRYLMFSTEESFTMLYEKGNKKNITLTVLSVKCFKPLENKLNEIQRI